VPDPRPTPLEQIAAIAGALPWEADEEVVTLAPHAEPEPAWGAARTLARAAIFSDLPGDGFAALAERAVTLRLVPGETVLREGDGGASLFLVASGRLAVSRRDEAGKDVVFARLREGDVFGELALLTGAPRSATVTAEQATEALELAPEALQAVAARHPRLATALRRFARQRILANAMTLSPVFRPFAPGDRRLVMARFRARDVAEGEVIVREGDPSGGLHVVLAGECDVVKRRGGAEVGVGRLRPGDLFGEMSCLRKTPASATVRVRRRGALLRLPRTEFDELVVTHPQILELVASLTEERADSLDAILAGHAQWTEDGLVLI
jgi:CRP-like cAMP-binding protein